MSDYTLLDFVWQFGPIVLLVVVWAYIAWKSRNMYVGKGGKTHGQMLEEHIGEMRRQNDLLERIVKDQEVRLQRVEMSL